MKKSKVLGQIVYFIVSKAIYIIPGLLLVIFYIDASGDTRVVSAKYRNLTHADSTLISTKEQFVQYADVLIQQELLKEMSRDTTSGVTPIAVMETAITFYEEFDKLVFPTSESGDFLFAPYYYLYYDLVRQQITKEQYRSISIYEDGEQVDYEVLYEQLIKPLSTSEWKPATPSYNFLMTRLESVKEMAANGALKNGYFARWKEKGETADWCAIFTSCVYYEAQKEHIGFFPFSENCMRQLGGFIESGAEVHIIPGTNGALHWDTVKDSLVSRDIVSEMTLQRMQDNILMQEYEPKVGDIMYCVDDPSNNGGWYASHVRIVIEYDAETKMVTTIEGNNGSTTGSPLSAEVQKKEYQLTGRNSIFVTPCY